MKLSLALVIVVNLVFAAAYLWSRGGQGTHVRVEVRGDEVSAWLDGKLIATDRFATMAPSGGVVIRVEPTEFMPSLPEPRGIDRLVVTDLQTGERIFEDDFSTLDPAMIQRGVTFVEDGHVRAENLVIIGPFGNAWRDIRVDVDFDNIQAGGVMVRSDGWMNGASANFRHFRHLDSSVQMLVDRAVVESAPGPRLEASRGQVMRSLVAMALRGYPALLLATMALTVVVFVSAFAPLPQDLPQRWQRFLHDRGVSERRQQLLPWLGVAVLAVGAVIATAYINTEYNARLPHVPDEVSYIFQARLLASGRLSAPPPPVQESFDYFYPPLIALSDGKWASIYPFGHPLVLAIGVKLGIMWLMPPLVGGATLLLLFAAARRIYSLRVGLLAVILFAASPFFLMTASNYMSHNTAVLYITACLLFIAMRDRRPVAMPVLAGVCFGLLLNTRPLTATALVVPFALMLLAWLVPPDNRILAVKSVAAFVVGGASMLVAYGLYNLGTTGDLFLAGYSTGADLNEVVGFGGAHSLSLGLQNEQTQMSSLLLVFNGWPQFIGIVLVAAPFVMGSRNRWDWTFLMAAVAVMGVYTFYEAPGLMHGPRYWYEAMPFLVLLAARGADSMATAASSLVAYLRESAGAVRRADWAGFAIVYPAVVALSLLAANDWLRGGGLDFRVDAVPNSAAELRGFNGMDGRMVDGIEDLDLNNALVLIGACPNWQCLGSVFWKNAPTLDGDVVYARNLPNRNGELFAEYPDRRVYEATYGSGDVWVYGGGLAPHDGDDGDVPIAGEIPTATPQPTPTPDPAIAQRSDAQRMADLQEVAQALESYRAEHGSYPLAEGVQTLCGYSFDSACGLDQFIDIPRDPRSDATYWYQSDGETFYVFASLESPADAPDCPDPVPQHLVTVPNLYCVRGGVPSAEQ